MSSAPGAFPWVMAGLREGMSANAIQRGLQEIGLGIRRQDLLRLVKFTRAITSVAGEEAFRDITAVPSASEIAQWPTKKATGYAQTVSLIYEDRITGALAQTFYRYKTPQPVTRELAMATAIGAYSDKAEEYNQNLIGAIHTSTYQNIPIQAQAA